MNARTPIPADQVECLLKAQQPGDTIEYRHCTAPEDAVCTATLHEEAGKLVAANGDWVLDFEGEVFQDWLSPKRIYVLLGVSRDPDRVIAADLPIGTVLANDLGRPEYVKEADSGVVPWAVIGAETGEDDDTVQSMLDTGCLRVLSLPVESDAS